MWNRLLGRELGGSAGQKPVTENAAIINRPKPISTAGRQANDDHTKNIVYLRFLMSGILLVAAALCSTLSYFLLRGGETKLFQTQYDSIATSALNSVVSNFGRMNLGLQAMASTYSANFPDAQEWPYVAWPGFRRTADTLGTISAIDNISFSPLVRAANLSQYEKYMAAYYANDTTLIPPDYIVPYLTAGMVWSLDEQLIPIHESTGCTPFSHQCLMLPSSQYTYSETIGPSYLGYNLHSYPKFAGVFDASIKCAAENNATYAANHCGGVSTFVELPFGTYLDPNPEVLDIQAQLAHPILPLNDPSTLVGFMSGAISWRKLLAEAVPVFARDLDCVISDERAVFTYTISDGIPLFAGRGDLHQEEYSKYKKSRTLTSPSLSGTGLSTYVVTFYPRRDFAERYTTATPIYAAVALVLVFFICTAVFVTYDVLMHRESDRQAAILDTKRRFVRFISHEIRTPLNTVRLGMKLFESELNFVAASIAKASPAEVVAVAKRALSSWRTLVDDILTNSETAVEVLDDLLNYDKIEVGTLRLEYSLFNIYDLVKKTASVMQIQAQQKNILLEIVNPGHSPAGTSEQALAAAFMIGDSYRMGQVLRNLISNALKFTPSGGNVSLTVKVDPTGMPGAPLPVLSGTPTPATAALRTAIHAGSITIAVKDSGAGLTPNQLESICSEGVQFNANQLQAGQGSGLGLFISKGIIDQHGGKLTITSEGLGKGVMFSLEIPIYREPAVRPSLSPEHSISSSAGSKSNAPPPLPSADVEAALLAELQNQEALRAPARTHHLLVVDDSPFNRKMLCRLLCTKGYECEQAEDGADAIKVYNAMIERGDTVDAILMDFEMPVMNGPTATAKLREQGCTCLIIGVTGNVLPDEQNFFRSRGANHVLPKPFKMEEFELIMGEQPSRPRLHSSEKVTVTTKLTEKTHSFASPRANSGQIHPMDEIV